VARIDASFTSGHRIKPPFRPLLAAQTLARRAAGADDAEPLFVAPDNAQPATPRHVRNWLARIGRETGLRFDATSDGTATRPPRGRPFTSSAPQR
jgi:hypothetical protein